MARLDIYSEFSLFSAKVENAHKEFQKAISAAICRYVPERNTLAVITRNKTTKQIADMLLPMYFRCVRSQTCLQRELRGR
jgi:fragile X mental retardation protein